MKKIVFGILILFASIANAQIKPVDETAKAEPIYDVKEDSVTVEKIYYEEKTIYLNIDELWAQIEKYNADIASNEKQILYFQDLIAKIEAEIIYLKELGAKEGEKPKEEGEGK